MKKIITSLVLTSLTMLSADQSQCKENESFIPALGTCVATSGTSSSAAPVHHITYPTNVSHQLFDAIANHDFDISGSFAAYDFGEDGKIDPFDWTFVLPNGRIFQLQGNTPTDTDIFGWKETVITPNDSTFLMAYMGDWDNDGDARFDWLVLDIANQKVYKLNGVVETGAYAGTFDYLGPIEIQLNITDTQVLFEKGQTVVGDGECVSDFPGSCSN